MDVRELILSELSAHARQTYLGLGPGSFTWDDVTFLRACVVRQQHADDTAWSDFVERLKGHPSFASATRSYLRERGYVVHNLADHHLALAAFPEDTKPLSASDSQLLLEEMDRTWPMPAAESAHPEPQKTGKTRIMYIEEKPGLAGAARIGRVSFSQTGKTIYYATVPPRERIQGQLFQC